MTLRKHGYRRGSGAAHASKERDEFRFCTDRPDSEFDNEFRWCIWMNLLCDADELIASMWFHHKGDAIPAYVRDHPGQRPSCWWVYEAKIDVNDIPATPQEQATFLAKHGYLTAAERKRLPDDWFKSETPKLKILR